MTDKPDQGTDWVSRLESVQTPPTPPAVLEPLTPEKPLETASTTAQDAPGATADQPKPAVYLPNRPSTAQDTKPNPEGRCEGCGLVLCGCARGDRVPEHLRLPQPEPPSRNSFDISELYPHRPGETTFLGGRFMRYASPQENASAWAAFDAQQDAERERLIGELLERRRQEDSERAENLSRYGTTTAPTIRPFGSRLNADKVERPQCFKN